MINAQKIKTPADKVVDKGGELTAEVDSTASCQEHRYEHVSPEGNNACIRHREAYRSRDHRFDLVCFRRTFNRGIGTILGVVF